MNNNIFTRQLSDLATQFGASIASDLFKHPYMNFPNLDVVMKAFGNRDKNTIEEWVAGYPNFFNLPEDIDTLVIMDDSDKFMTIDF